MTTNTPEPKAEQQTKIEKFAKDILGIELFSAQVEMIEAWSKGQTIIERRRMGLSTANKVIRAYVAESLRPEQPHPTTSQDSEGEVAKLLIGVFNMNINGEATIEEMMEFDTPQKAVAAIQAYANRARLDEFEKTADLFVYENAAITYKRLERRRAQLAPQREGELDV